VTLLAFTVAGAVGALFMFIQLDPDRARSLGLLGTKAQLAGGAADWSGYLALVAQIVGLGGLLLFGLVVVWLFGREFSDRTAKDLLALPTSRRAIVSAKLIVALGWCLGLTVYLAALSLSLGALLGLPDASGEALLGGLGRVAATALLTITLTTGYGLVACVGRGYLPAVGAMFGTLFAAQVVGALGYGAWFPFSVPSLLSGAAGPGQSPGVVGIGSVLVLGAAAVAATVAWWERADHAR
jgi:ABC-2 type transport system permease protein